MAKDLDYFVYPGHDGTLVIVPRLTDVPAEFQAKAKHIDLSKPALRVAVGEPAHSSSGSAKTSPSAEGGIVGHLAAFHGPSFFLGMGSAMILGCLVALSIRRTTRIFSLVLGLILMGTLSLGYMTYIRRQAGFHSPGMTSPKVLLDDARESAAAMKKRYADQEKILQSLEK